MASLRQETEENGRLPPSDWRLDSVPTACPPGCPPPPPVRLLTGALRHCLLFCRVFAWNFKKWPEQLTVRIQDGAFMCGILGTVAGPGQMESYFCSPSCGITQAGDHSPSFRQNPWLAGLLPLRGDHHLQVKR